MAVVATVGTTSTTSVDPVGEIAAVCRERGIWLHVDAAYGGAMALVPEGKWAMQGVELADSVVVNPHKWMFVPLDFSALFVRRPELLRAVFALTPEYLSGDAAAGEINYMDYGLQLGRRFRALKAWMVFRAFGRDGLAARISEHRRLAQEWARWVEADPRFVLAAPVPMAVVCFRFAPAGLEPSGLRSTERGHRPGAERVRRRVSDAHARRPARRHARGHRKHPHHRPPSGTGMGTGGPGSGTDRGERVKPRRPTSRQPGCETAALRCRGR